MIVPEGVPGHHPRFLGPDSQPRRWSHSRSPLVKAPGPVGNQLTSPMTPRNATGVPCHTQRPFADGCTRVR
jgi:hypothetical protein